MPPFGRNERGFPKKMVQLILSSQKHRNTRLTDFIVWAERLFVSCLSVKFAKINSLSSASNVSKLGYLALQLFFYFEVRALSGSLVSSTPE
jgi:hypothetical protein